MRTIKFRGQPVSEVEYFDDDEEMPIYPDEWERADFDGKFVYGNLICEKHTYYIVGGIADNEYGSLEYWIPVIPKTVGQFVDQTDIDGKDIYEGHLLEKEGIVYEIVFAIGDFFGKSKSDISIYSYIDIDDLSDAKIIGNVYDNPELLTVNP